MAEREPWCRITDDGRQSEIKLEFGGGVDGIFQARLDDLKRGLRYPGRRWDPEQRCWWIGATQESRLNQWVEVWFYPHQVQRVDPRRPAPRPQQPPPPPPPPPDPARAPTVTEAYAVLHLLPTAPPALIKAAFKCLAVLHHPDKGGDVERMKKVNVAFDVLRPVAGA